MASPLLRLVGVTRSFGGLAAVQDVSLELPAGGIGALIGPNGAGKTTLFALASGFLRPDRGSMPSLGYLLLLFLLVGWFLPGVSFFLDRYRVPVLLVLIAISFVSNQIFDTDHFYRIQRETAPAAPLPAQAFNASHRMAPEDRPIVVVAASGGGITASLWTARVLTSLQREVGEDFTRSIRLISSVSGGSSSCQWTKSSKAGSCPSGRSRRGSSPA